jgi:hypothetical protein
MRSLTMNNLVRTFREFKSRIERYHGADISSQHDTEDYLAVYGFTNSNNSFPNKEQFKSIINGYLLDWGGMYRWLDRTREEELCQIIFNVVDMVENKQVVAKIRGATINSEDEVRDFDENITNLYGTICETIVPITRKIGTEKRGRFGPTATGKLLHMLAPRICIIWDQAVVRGPNNLDEDGHAYVGYIHEKWNEWDKVKEDFVGKQEFSGEPAQEILRIHQRFLVKEGYSDGTIYEPVTKLLDEANYGT